LPEEVSESFCQVILRLADLSLQALSTTTTTTTKTNDASSLPLATTFLRALQHPALVQDLLHALSSLSSLADDKSEFGMLWSTMEHQIRTNNATNANPDLKRVVQTAILTLGWSGTRNGTSTANACRGGAGSTSSSTANSNDNLEWQTAQALMDRLLPMLAMDSDDGDNNNDATRVPSPTGVATPNRNQGNSHKQGNNNNNNNSYYKYNPWDAFFVRQWEHMQQQYQSQGQAAMAMDYDM
jgi:hypothetical protein